jgi:RecB family exonuclease
LSQLGPEKTAEALTENQFALAALRDGRRVPASLYNSRLRRSLEAYRCRWSRNFTPHDGFIHSPELLASISQWADQQFFSPSRLEIFATCPYRFFLLKLLRLQAVQDPETIQKISPLDKGGLVHKILDAFMRGAREKGWFPLAVQHAAWLHRLLDEVAQEAFGEAEERGATGYQLLWELDSEQILADLHTFVQKEIERTDAVVPDRFEVDFGAAGSTPFQLTLPDGSCLSLTGRIDRVDIDRARSAIRVVDYKTGMYRLNEQAIFEGGRKLQLPLYLMAAAELYGLSSLEESVAEYYFVSSLGKFHVHPFTGENWEQKEKQLAQILQIITTAMRRGRFPARPGPGKQNCKWCDYRLVCDKAVDRIHSFKVHSPELEFLGLLEDYP